MLRFPIHWQFSDPFKDAILNLDSEWALSCQWMEDDWAESYIFESIEIRRKTTCEVTSIFGTFSLQINHKKESTYAFSRLLKSGSAVTKLIDLNVPIDLDLTRCFLHGFVNIISVNGNFVNQSRSLVQLSDDFGRLLDPGTSCSTDINLKCGSASIPAHKLILSARSPVFAAMFKNQMKESHKNEVDIIDIEASVLQAMVTYIYSGKTPDLTESFASDLLFAAEKYHLPDLKSVCCEFLKENISMQNVIRFLNLGDMLAEDLKSFSVDYMCRKYTTLAEFEKTEECVTLMKEKPALAVHVLASLLKSNDAKRKK